MIEKSPNSTGIEKRQSEEKFLPKERNTAQSWGVVNK